VSVCHFTATNEYYKDKQATAERNSNGNIRRGAAWLDMVAEHPQKRQVYIEGKLRTRQYQDRPADATSRKSLMRISMRCGRPQGTGSPVAEAMATRVPGA
jgi:single-stranded DNA-binding protein